VRKPGRMALCTWSPGHGGFCRLKPRPPFPRLFLLASGRRIPRVRAPAVPRTQSASRPRARDGTYDHAVPTSFRDAGGAAEGRGATFLDALRCRGRADCSGSCRREARTAPCRRPCATRRKLQWQREACPPHCARRPRRSSFSSPPAASDRLLLQAQFVRGMFVAGATVTLFRPGAEVPFQWERETPGRDAKARPSSGLDGLCRRLPRRPARVEHGARRVPHPRHQAQGGSGAERGAGLQRAVAQRGEARSRHGRWAAGYDAEDDA